MEASSQGAALGRRPRGGPCITSTPAHASRHGVRDVVKSVPPLRVAQSIVSLKGSPRYLALSHDVPASLRHWLACCLLHPAYSMRMEGSVGGGCKAEKQLLDHVRGPAVEHRHDGPGVSSFACRLTRRGGAWVAQHLQDALRGTRGPCCPQPL